MGKRRIGLLVAGLLVTGALIGLLALSAGSGTAVAQGGQPTPFFESEDDPRRLAQMDRVQEATAILRDLEPLRPVLRAFISRDALLAYLTDTLDEDYPPALARDDAIFYHAFGFMALDVDLRAVQIAVLTEQIAGFYDPELEAMFVISGDGTMSALDQVVYAHEYTHVLQDQHYGLLALGLEDEDARAHPDASLAVLGLVEGDAMLMTEGYETWLLQSNPAAALNILGEGLFVSTEALRGAPAIVQVELLFPYTAGRQFAYTLFAAGEGWDLVDAAYENPPQSTEHILHPERYVAGDDPLPVEVVPPDDLPGDSWRLVWDRTLGEFYLREHLRAAIPRDVADAAAAGWGGDRYLIYFDDEAETTLLIYRIAWDTPADAAEFAAAYRGYGLARFGSPGRVTDENGVCWQAEAVSCFFAGENETLIVTVPEIVLLDDVLAGQPALR